MNQMIFMVVATSFGVLGTFAHGPFCGVAVYYLFAVLRPQHIWDWSLPDGIQWSLVAALSGIIGVFLYPASVTANNDNVQRESQWSRLNGAHFALLAYAIWISLTFLTANDREVAYPYFIEYLKIFVMFFVAAFAIRKP